MVMCGFFGTEGAHEISLSAISFARFVSKLFSTCSKVGNLECVVLFAILIMLNIIGSKSMPLVPPSRGNLTVSAISEAVVYMTKYGYLPPSDPSSGNLRMEKQLREAISTMQRFGNLTPTGMVDEATLQLMRRRRCGVPDILLGHNPYRIRRYAIQGQKWPKTNLSWGVKSCDSAADARMVRSQLRSAFKIWSEVSALTFIEVQGTTADILVSFLKGQHGDGYPFDGEGSVLAHAFFPGEGIGGDAHFDAEERWLSSQPETEDNDGVNLFAVAAHEIGHSLGLSHSSIPGSLMFPYYQVIDEHFRLPRDDADGIRHLYGVKDPKYQPTMPMIFTTTTQETEVTPWKTTEKTHVITINPTTSAPQVPDICNTSIDAISVIRREVFIFKGKYFWRLDTNRTLRAGYPVSVHRFWYDLPLDIKIVDALYERPIDTKIVFFSGKQYWLFSANRLEPGYPRPLADLGLPTDLERIDAAMVWGHNGKTYLFSGKEYWKFDEMEGRVELDYPRNINAWRGVPFNIDAAFQWIDGNTYFFKGRKFWKFVDVKMKVENVASEIGGFWFKCPGKTMEKTVPTTEKSFVLEKELENCAKINSLSVLCVLIILVLLK